MHQSRNRLLSSSMLLVLSSQSSAFEINDRFSIGGLLGAAGQCQDVSARLPSEDYEKSGTLDVFDNTCRGGMSFSLEFDYHPDDYNRFFANFKFAAGNALNPVSPWTLAPWATDLEDDVKNINGRDRDYLLTAWYKHTFTFQNHAALGATVGIIDSEDYLDGNAYANDEDMQFMNDTFVNSVIYNLASYDAGAALEFGYGAFTFNVVGMNIGENDDGNNYNTWGAEVGYHPKSSLGAGNYRLTLTGASSEFLDPTGDKKEGLLGYGVSFDQEFGDVVGGFLRLGWQKEDAAVDYKALYSAGFNFAGRGWGRADDNIGIGYAYLDGGNLGLKDTRLFEAYYRFVANAYVALTADVQYMSDEWIRVDSMQEDPDGWIFGLRATAEF